MPLEAGARLGAYEIVEAIGAGAMGEIYRAKDLKLGREVAIKVLPEALATDRERLRRFKQEAQAASALNHPNIVHIYDIGQEDELHYIVMELVPGVSLREALLEAPFAPRKVLDLARQLSAGLANAHAAGIVHRDIKPENIKLTPDGFIKILDFGLAKLLAHPFETHSEMATMDRAGTRHGMLIGTIEYMSPEQAAGKPVDHRSDQFSLGLILYEMVTGKLAFHRETAAQTLASIIESAPAPMVELNPECPPALGAIVDRCLEKDPDRRYPETAELSRALIALSVPRQDPPPQPAAAPPPLPPVPQNPDPDVPPLPPLPELPEPRVLDGPQVTGPPSPLTSTDYRVQKSDGNVVTLSDRRLRRALRKNRLSGDELVKLPGETRWTALYDSEVFRQEVPYRGDPRSWVRKRKLRDFGQHACSFVGVGVGWFIFQGEVPAWMGFWGIGLAAHAASVLPELLPWWRSGIVITAGDKDRPVIDVVPDVTKVAAELELPAEFGSEVARVRELLERRGGSDASQLLAEIDTIVDKLKDLSRKERDLAEQTSPEEQSRLEAAIAEAAAKHSASDAAGDRKLFKRQLDVLRERQSAIHKAVAVIDRLRARRDVAFNQIKQLRLDLSRAEAASGGAPELTSRLQDIKHEVDATEHVDEAIAQELLS